MPEYKYICLDCGYLFNEPHCYTETHGLDTPPYEHISCCPACGGIYDETIECDECGELFPFGSGRWINETTLVCKSCYEALRAAAPFYED